MICFIQNTSTKAIKISYSSKPNERLKSLQADTKEKLTLVGSIQGGLEHKAELQQRFARYALSGGWFKGDILPQVRAILAKEAANPAPLKTNVIVAGDSDAFIAWVSDKHDSLQTSVPRALDQIHAKKPIAWVITGGERHLDKFAWQWAAKNQVEVQQYYPKWKSRGRYAGFEVGPKMLRSMFDPKLLLVFLKGDGTPSTQRLIRQAEKDGIETVKVILK